MSPHHTTACAACGRRHNVRCIGPSRVDALRVSVNRSREEVGWTGVFAVWAERCDGRGVGPFGGDDPS